MASGGNDGRVLLKLFIDGVAAAVVEAIEKTKGWDGEEKWKKEQLVW